VDKFPDILMEKGAGGWQILQDRTVFAAEISILVIDGVAFGALNVHFPQ
jgi:hypothetical protein